MMEPSRTKCPFCGTELELDVFLAELHCPNNECHDTDYLQGNENLWEKLGQFVKRSKRFEKALKDIKNELACPPDMEYKDCVEGFVGKVLEEKDEDDV